MSHDISEYKLKAAQTFKLVPAEQAAHNATIAMLRHEGEEINSTKDYVKSIHKYAQMYFDDDNAAIVKQLKSELDQSNVSNSVLSELREKVNLQQQRVSELEQLLESKERLLATVRDTSNSSIQDLSNNAIVLSPKAMSEYEAMKTAFNTCDKEADDSKIIEYAVLGLRNVQKHFPTHLVPHINKVRVPKF